MCQSIDSICQVRPSVISTVDAAATKILDAFERPGGCSSLEEPLSRAFSFIDRVECLIDLAQEFPRAAVRPTRCFVQQDEGVEPVLSAILFLSIRKTGETPIVPPIC